MFQVSLRLLLCLKQKCLCYQRSKDLNCLKLYQENEEEEISCEMLGLIYCRSLMQSSKRFSQQMKILANNNVNM